MTVIVGVKCTDGIVIGADSAATSSNGVIPLMQVESNDKIRIFGSNVIVACTGSIGYAQRLYDHVDSAVKGKVFTNLTKRECTTNITKRFMTDLANSCVQMHPQHGLGFGAVLAFPFNGGPCLIEYGTKDFQPEEKDERLFFVSMGSGQTLADPFLAFINRVLWKGEKPSLEMGRLGVYWTLNHVINYAPMGVGGKIRIATLSKTGNSWAAIDVSDTDESAQFIVEVEREIREQANRIVNLASVTSPPPPPPAA
jgi:hypothetical protein